MNFTKVVDEEAFHQAMKLTKGCYQRNLLRGIESLSGSTLKGKARKYSTRYSISRINLLNRIKNANIIVSECKGKHNSRILVIG